MFNNNWVILKFKILLKEIDRRCSNDMRILRRPFRGCQACWNETKENTGSRHCRMVLRLQVECEWRSVCWMERVPEWTSHLLSRTCCLRKRVFRLNSRLNSTTDWMSLICLLVVRDFPFWLVPYFKKYLLVNWSYWLKFLQSISAKNRYNTSKLLS